MDDYTYTNEESDLDVESYPEIFEIDDMLIHDDADEYIEKALATTPSVDNAESALMDVYLGRHQSYRQMSDDLRREINASLANIAGAASSALKTLLR